MKITPAMNDLERHMANAAGDLRMQIAAGFEITDQVIEDLANEHALNYVREREPYQTILAALKAARKWRPPVAQETKS